MTIIHAWIAQSVERVTVNHKVNGSIPFLGVIFQQLLKNKIKIKINTTITQSFNNSIQYCTIFSSNTNILTSLERVITTDWIGHE